MSGQKTRDQKLKSYLVMNSHWEAAIIDSNFHKNAYENDDSENIRSKENICLFC